MDDWIRLDRSLQQDGLAGNLDGLQGIDDWTSSADDCLDISDMGKPDEGEDELEEDDDEEAD